MFFALFFYRGTVPPTTARLIVYTLASASIPSESATGLRVCQEAGSRFAHYQAVAYGESNV